MILFSHCFHMNTKKAIINTIIAFSTWSHLGLNQGLPDYESGALTNWAIGPANFLFADAKLCVFFWLCNFFHNIFSHLNFHDYLCEVKRSCNTLFYMLIIRHLKRTKITIENITPTSVFSHAGYMPMIVMVYFAL